MEMLISVIKYLLELLSERDREIEQLKRDKENGRKNKEL